MMTFRLFAANFRSIPVATGWYLADIGQALGRQELFTRQSPQRLRKLREHALIESAVSSNRIEGVEVDPRRAATLVFGSPLLRDRDEEEVRGYRDALNLVHERGRDLPVTEATAKRLHRMARGKVWDAGKYKDKAQPIVEHQPGGGTRVRFMPVEAGARTEAAMAELVERWATSVRDRLVHPLVAVGAFGLDFLCIHPFRDGNGRVSRLLMLLLCYDAGAEVGRYVSLERLIERSKDRYYETLEQCSQGWHDGKHDPWPFINYILWVLKEAYAEFERRVGQTREPRGAKTAMIQSAIGRRHGEFTLAQLERECPGISRDMIRRVLRDHARRGEIECRGRGPAARWRRRGNTAKKG